MTDGFTILNVDDNEIGRYAKTRSLTRVGFRVVDAGTGTDALRLVGELLPDLVLLDVKLPDMSGIEVCAAIKRDFPSIAVLQISATFTDKHARIRGLEAGADAYVTQPIEADELVANVRALLRLKAAEDELRRLNDTLEQRVAQRTHDLEAAVEQLREEARNRELAEEALRQAQKMEAIGQLTGGVAHDFNNLLTIIRSATDLLRRHELPEDKRRRYIDAISDTADRAAKLTAQLLAFARRQALAPEVFDVGARVESVASMLATIVGPGVAIRTDVAAGGCHVLADPSQLETALVNMAVNARDAMAGQGTLTISVAPLAGEDGDTVALAVGDTGQGIAADVLNRVFEPFFTTKDVGKGTGLGLSQVFGFAKQSGGEVRVESTPGHGSLFTLMLPAIAASGMPAPLAAATLTGELPAKGEILLVEDNENVGELSMLLVADLGYGTTLVPTAAEALLLVAAEPHRFDLVLTDVVMPGMGGVELAAALRAAGHRLPILMMSGYSDTLAERGARDFPLLQKPFSVEALSQAIRRALRAPVSAAPAPVPIG